MKHLVVVLVALSGVLLGFVHFPVAAQVNSESNHDVEVGVTTQVVVMERAPIATGVGGHVSWWAGSRWGLRAEFQRDAGVNRDLRDVYVNTGQWGDHRRLNGTVAVLWEPVQGTLGTVQQSLRVSVGPTVQRQWGETARWLGHISNDQALLRMIREPGADNVYIAEAPDGNGQLVLRSEYVRHTNVGLTIGVSYGITYGPVLLRLLGTGRKVTNVDGWTFGAGGGVAFTL